jgi:hypothetical protein
MIKQVFVFEPTVSIIEADRYYFRYHAPEIVRWCGPWLRRYETFRAYDAPPEADRFGASRGRMSEVWYDNMDTYKEAALTNKPFTLPSYGLEGFLGPTHLEVLVPALPTEDFLGKEPTPEERPILRWYRVIKYPEGVSVAEGEKWYLDVYAKEAKKQVGLLRYIGYRALENQPPDVTHWHRVDEMWYEDFDAWRKAVIDSPPRYTPPRWRKEEPFVDMISAFIPYRPDADLLYNNLVIP